MKLNVKDFRHLSPDEWRVLTAFEMGSKNHEVVPTALVTQLAALKSGSGGVQKSISTLAKAGLIAKVKNNKYDGYRLAYGGYDYLALHALTRSDAVLQLGSTLGVGKESDIMLVTSPSTDIVGAQMQAVLKIHRLGRVSFRSVARNRDYLGKRSHTSWQYLSRLSAQKEHLAMRTLRDAGIRVPRPIAQNRHTVVMTLIPGMPLRAVPLSAFGRNRGEQEWRVSNLYAELIELIMNLAERGLIHGDMNEFNVMLEGVRLEQADPEGDDPDEYEERTALEEEEGGNDHDSQSRHVEEVHSAETEEETETSDQNQLVPHIIDFPQILSMGHTQAEEYFDRDVRGIKAFFRKRYHFESDDGGPHFADAEERLREACARGMKRLDIKIEASGFSKRVAQQLNSYYTQDSTEGDDAEVDLNAFGDLELGFDEQAEIDQISKHGTKASPLKSKANAGWSI